LYLRVRATGGRSWVLRRKRGGHIEIITVGAWPALGLAQARLEVRHALRRGARTDRADRALSILKIAALRRRRRRSPDLPVDRLSSELVAGVELSRDPVVTDEELRKLRPSSAPQTALLRFLLLTGRRDSAM
jgi:Arm domain-containing DNA-binding protein